MSIALIFFLSFFSAARAGSIDEWPTSAKNRHAEQAEVAELVARACPDVIIHPELHGVAPERELRDYIRACDRELERIQEPDRPCDPDRDGLCVGPR